MKRSNPTPAAEQTPTTGYPDQIDRALVYRSTIERTSQLALRLAVLVASAIGVAWLVSQFWAGVLPMVLAIIVCTVLATPTNWLRRRGVPSGLAAFVSVFVAFALVATLIWSMAPGFVRQSQVLYLQAADGVQRVQLWVQQLPLDDDRVNEAFNNAASWIQEQLLSGNVAASILSGVSTATSIAATVASIFILTFFFLKDGHKFLPWLRKATGRVVGLRLTELLTRAWRTLSGFIRTQALVSLVDASVIGMGLFVLGVPMALTLGVLTFLAGFVPLIGAVVAGAVGVLVTLVSEGVAKALIALAIVVLVQQLDGNILSPVLQSRAMELHPVIVLVSVIIGGGLFNIIGAFLAVPFSAMIAVVWRYFLDLSMIRSGELKASEVKFVTRAGEWTGRYAEEQGRLLRRSRQEDNQVLRELNAWDAHDADQPAQRLADSDSRASAASSTAAAEAEVAAGARVANATD